MHCADFLENFKENGHLGMDAKYKELLVGKKGLERNREKEVMGQEEGEGGDHNHAPTFS